MTAKRFTVKSQDDYFGVVDNNTEDKVCVVNGIRTEIEAEWLCKDMNALNDENEQLKEQQKLLVTECRYQNKQKHNLITFLKRCCYGDKEIRQICKNGDVE